MSHTCGCLKFMKNINNHKDAMHRTSKEISDFEYLFNIIFLKLLSFSFFF